MLYVQLAAIAAATALVAAGCGKSSTTTTTSQASEHSSTSAGLTQSELIAKADAICQRVNAQRAASTIKTQKELAQVLPQLTADEQAAATELAKLIPPTALASDWHVIVAGNQTLANDIAKLGVTITAKNTKATKVILVRDAQTQDKMVAVAKRDGFASCAQAS